MCRSQPAHRMPLVGVFNLQRASQLATMAHRTSMASSSAIFEKFTIRNLGGRCFGWKHRNARGMVHVATVIDEFVPSTSVVAVACSHTRRSLTWADLLCGLTGMTWGILHPATMGLWENSTPMKANLQETAIPKVCTRHTKMDHLPAR